MPRDIRNRLHIYYKEKYEEKHVIVYPKSICGNKTNWRNFCIENAYELYSEGITQCCKVFDALTPEDIALRYEFAWDSISHPSLPDDLDEKNRIKQTDDYRMYKELWVQSHIRECTESMFSDAYTNLYRACLIENGSNRFELRKESDVESDRYKSYFDLNYLFYDMLGNQETELINHGAWVMRDGSYITLDTAHHCRFVTEYLGYSEYDIERYWVKVSLGTVHTHNRMTDAQKKTLNKFFKKYEDLYERNLEDW